MKKHWDEVRKAVEALGIIAQNADPDGIELRFISQPAAKLMCNKAATLVAHVNSNKLLRDSHFPMEHALNTLINELMPPLQSASKARVSLTKKALNLLKSHGGAASKTGISVYVLTNGVWGASGDGSATVGGERLQMFNIDQSIRTLVARLKEQNASRSWFTLQFIRFGRDAASRARLRYLDNGLTKELAGWDIVDSRSYDHGSVRAMLIGALCMLNDDAEDSDDDDDDDDDSHKSRD